MKQFRDSSNVDGTEHRFRCIPNSLHSTSIERQIFCAGYFSRTLINRSWPNYSSTDGFVPPTVYGRTDGRNGRNGRTEGRTGGRASGRTDGRAGGRVGRTDGRWGSGVWGSRVWGSRVWGSTELGQRFSDLELHMPILEKQYRGPLHLRLLFRESEI